MPVSLPIRCCLSAVIGMAAVACGRSAVGQSALPPGTANFALPVSPDLSAAIGLAEQALAQQDWARAANVLQLILDAEEDAFLAPDDPRSVQGRASEIVAQLSTAGRQQYERLFAPAAEAVLADPALTDTERWSELTRRFLHTPAGLQAAWRLARLRQDQGAAIAAARLFEELLADAAGIQRFGDELLLRAALACLASGDAQRAGEHLQTLATRGTKVVTLQGRPVTLPALDDLTPQWLAGLQGPPANSGDSARPSALSPPFLPPSGPPAWTLPALCTDELLVLYPDRAAQLNATLTRLEVDQQTEAKQTGRLLLPAAAPLLVENRLVVRMPDRISAWSPDDGAVRWIATPVDFTYRELAESSEFHSRDDPTRTLYFGQRAWRDETSASLSSDGVNVYAVMDCGMLGAVDTDLPMQTSRHPKGPFRDNVLQAFSLRGGKQRWSIGGPAGTQPDPLAGLFFLGPPLPHEGRLYVLAEDRGQVRLLVLDPGTRERPRLVWSQALFDLPPQLSVEFDQARRTLALSPVAFGNLLVCPTGAGTVVAVDVLERRLAWASTYRLPVEEVPRSWRGRRPGLQGDLVTRQRVALDGLLDAEGWRSPALLPAGDRLLVAARDADALLCLRAFDGAQLWRRPRGDGIFLADVSAERAAIVGRSTISSLRLTDGEPAWQQPTSIPAPSGRGFAHHGLYTLPLSTGEVATLSLETGRMLVRSPLAGGSVAGNLIAAEGRLISQSAAKVEAWPALTPSDLADTVPMDPTELARRGELRLHGGDVEAGVADLREAVRQGSGDRTRRVLAGALLAGLQADFDALRADAPEIERLIAGSPDEPAFRRMYAEQLQAHGEPVAAFQQWLRLGELQEAGQELREIDPQWSVSPDRWIEARVQDLFLQATADEREQMLQGLTERLNAALAQPAAADVLRSLQGLVRIAQGTPLAPRSTRELAVRLPAYDLVRQEELWRSLRTSGNAEFTAEATARLAALYLQADETLAAAPLIAELRGALANRTCLEGRTGAELLTAWSQDQRLRDRLAAAVVEPAWSGPFEVTPDRPQGDLGPFRVLPVVGPVSGPFARWTFAYDETQFRLTAYTPAGRFGWEAAVGTDAGVERAAPQSVFVRGGLVMVQWDSRFQLISALTPDGGRYRTVTGGRSLVADASDVGNLPIFQGRQDRMGRGLGLCGPLTANLICYQSGTQLIGLDPATGSVVWRRQNPAGASQILADDEYVVVRPYGQGELLVLRAMDGRLLHKCPLPAEVLTPPPVAAWGRRLAVLTKVDDQSHRLSMFDPVTRRSEWSRDLPSPLHWSTIDGGTILVVDAEQRCVLIDPADGRELLNVTLPVAAEEEPWDSLTAWADRERVYVVLNRRQDAAVLRFDRQMVAERPVNGWLCAIDRSSGALAWSADVEGLYVDPQLPPEWPVLVLAAHQRIGDASEAHVVRRVLDKATGQSVHDSESPGKTSARRFAQQTSWRVTGQPPVLRLQQATGVLEIRPTVHGLP